MDRYLAKISTLLVEPTPSQRTVCRAFAAKPTPEREVALGKLFGFAELVPGGERSAALLGLLLDEVRQASYAGPWPSSVAAAALPNLEENFQGVLQRANLTVAKFLENGGTGVNLGRSTLLLGTVRQHQLVLASVGPINGFLFHYRPRQPYQIISIMDGSAESPVHPLRLFNQTISGSVGPLDYVFCCSSAVLDYLSLHTITAAVTGNLGVDAVRQLKLAIAKANPRSSALGVIISLVLQRTTSVAPPGLQNFDYAKAAAKDSMRELSRTQRRTTRMLSPRLMPDLQQFGRWVRESARRYLGRVKNAGARARPASPSPAAAGTPRMPRRRFPHVWSGLVQALRTIGSWLRRVLQHPTVKAVNGTIGQLGAMAWRRFRSQPLGRQLILTASVALTLWLGYNLTVIASRQAARGKEQAFASVLAEVEQARGDAQSALIYQDEGRAREQLRTALRLLDQLPGGYAQHPTVARARREITENLQNLRHETRIAEPIQLGSFSNLTAGAKTPPVLIQLKRALLTQDLGGKGLFLLRLDSRRIEQLPASAAAAAFRSAAAFRGGAMVLDAEGRLLQMNASGSLQPIPLDLPGGRAAALNTFRERLYLLHPTAGMIFRADPITGGFDRPRRWLADGSVDLSAAVDIALDGDLYVLTALGGVLRLRQGRPVEFHLADIDPPISGPTKIKTTEKSQFLYLLDPPTKRLIVVDKNGKLVQQYTSPLFDQLQDVVVDEAERSLYLLNGTKIFGVPMEHLER